MSSGEANTPESLRRRAQLVMHAAASAVVAKQHLEQAAHHAKHGRLDVPMLKDLRAGLDAIDRSLRHAEQCRLRLLRKADRMECEAVASRAVESSR